MTDGIVIDKDQHRCMSCWNQIPKGPRLSWRVRIVGTWECLSGVLLAPSWIARDLFNPKTPPHTCKIVGKHSKQH